MRQGAIARAVVGSVVIVLGGCLLLGCGGSADSGREVAQGPDARLGRLRSPAPSGIAKSEGGSGEFDKPPGGSALPRKIIYNGELELVVRTTGDFEKLQGQLQSLVASAGAYIADSQVSRASGAIQGGQWRIRVPADRFESFMSEVERLALAKNRSTTAQDVTAEFVDLEARLKNGRRLEERIVKLLDDKTGKLADVIAVEKELARVRGEIEQMEGRLRYLNSVTQLATLALRVSVEEDYVPPSAPPFLASIGRALGDSATALVRFAKGVVLLVAAAMPWVVSLGVLVVGPAWVVRRRLRRVHGTTA